MTGIITS